MYSDNTEIFEYKDVKYTVLCNNRIIILALYLTSSVIESKIVNVCSYMHYSARFMF